MPKIEPNNLEAVKKEEEEEVKEEEEDYYEFDSNAHMMSDSFEESDFAEVTKQVCSAFQYFDVTKNACVELQIYFGQLNDLFSVFYQTSQANSGNL